MGIGAAELDPVRPENPICSSKRSDFRAQAGLSRTRTRHATLTFVDDGTRNTYAMPDSSPESWFQAHRRNWPLENLTLAPKLLPRV